LSSFIKSAEEISGIFLSSIRGEVETLGNGDGRPTGRFGRVGVETTVDERLVTAFEGKDTGTERLAETFSEVAIAKSEESVELLEEETVEVRNAVESFILLSSSSINE
jgi:hypothetical protein